MHVGLNLVYLVPGETGGMETYARELIPHLAAAAPQVRFTAFVNREAAGTPGPWNGGVNAVTVPVNARRRAEWVRGEQLLLPRLASRERVHLLHSLGGTAPWRGAPVRVATIHDLNYLRVPDAHFGVRGLGMRVLVPLAARRSHRLIADSQSTRDDLVTLLGVAAERIDVVHLGVRAPAPEADRLPAAVARERFGLAARTVILSPSAKRPHKNLERLLEAVALLPAPRPVLVIPGYPTPHEQQLRQRAMSLGVADDVRFPGWIGGAELEGLHAAAAGVVFPSLYEGFGLPVLEAMARGVPVACSSTSSLGEIAGDAAITFDPLDVAGIAAAIGRLAAGGAGMERLRAAGRARAARFTWEAAAARTLESYRRAAARASLGGKRPVVEPRGVAREG